MAQRTIQHEGVFTGDDRTAVNDNFTDLFGTTAGGALSAGEIMVGDATNVAAPVAVSGDATLADDGTVTVTGLNGAAVTADGTEVDALVAESVNILAAAALIASISTVNVPAPEIWNDNGVLKLGDA